MSVNGNCVNGEEKAMKHDEEKCNYTALWGEYRYVNSESASSEHDDIAKQELIQNVIRKAMRPDSEPEPRIAESDFIEFPQNLLRSDSTVLHTVQLQAYARDMEETIRSVEAGGDDKLYAIAPDLPPTAKKIAPRKLHFPFAQMERDTTDFAVGLAKPEPRLSSINARLVLRKSVATLLVHIGCHEVHEPVLDVLTDVAESTFTALGERLRVAVDQETMTGQAGFHDPVERAFTEMSLGSVEDLLDHYRKHVIGYHERVQRKCVQLQARYNKLAKARADSMSAVELEEELGVGEEEAMEEEEGDEDVPEIHFPALDEEDQLGIQPSLEPGFQMLDSLEHDETLQNLDPDEEINVSDSPSQDFMLSVISELSNTIDSTKAKKRKRK